MRRFCPRSLLIPLQVELVTRAFFGGNSSAVLEQYHESPPYARFGSLLTDALLTCYTRHVARLISSSSNGSVRLYAHPPSSFPTMYFSNITSGTPTCTRRPFKLTPPISSISNAHTAPCATRATTFSRLQREPSRLYHGAGCL